MISWFCVISFQWMRAKTVQRILTILKGPQRTTKQLLTLFREFGFSHFTRGERQWSMKECFLQDHGKGVIQIISDIIRGGGGVNTMSHRLYLYFETLFQSQKRSKKCHLLFEWPLTAYFLGNVLPLTYYALSSIYWTCHNFLINKIK